MTATPVPSPAADDLPTLLPMGGVVVTVGHLGDAWTSALTDRDPAADRIIEVATSDAESWGLDDVAEKEKLLDLHLLVIGPDAHAGRVLAHAGRMLGIFEPAVAVLGEQTLHDSLLDELGYARHPLPSGLLALLPVDDEE